MPRYTEKTSITQSQVYALIGLVTVADTHRQALRHLVQAGEDITGDHSGAGGHTDELIWGEGDGHAAMDRVMATLEKLDLAVVPDGREEPDAEPAP